MDIIKYLKKIYETFPICPNESLIIGSSVLYALSILKDKPRDIDIVLIHKSWRLMDGLYGSQPTLLCDEKIKIPDYKSKCLKIPVEFVKATAA